MNLVQPIRDKEKIREMMNELRAQSERNYMLFVLGVGTGLRISDIRLLKIGDFKDSHIRIKERKNNKFRNVTITSQVRRAMKEYSVGKSDEEYVLKSRQGVNQPISRSMAYIILNRAAKKCNIKNIGTHTMRKTFGYHFYQETKDIAMLRRILNHSSDQITLAYIGIEQDHIDKAMEKVKLF